MRKYLLCSLTSTSLAILFLGILVSINGCRTIQNDCLEVALYEQSLVGKGVWTKILIVDYDDAGYQAAHAMLLSEVGNSVWMSDSKGSFDTKLSKTAAPTSFGFICFLKSGYLRSGEVKILRSYFAEDN